MEVRCSFGDISIVWRVTVTLHNGCYRRRLQSRADRHIQLFDDLGRRLGWRKEHAPRTDGLETRQHVLHGRHIRERREWLTAGEREGAHTAVLDQSHYRRRRYKHDFNAAAEHAGHDFRGTLVVLLHHKNWRMCLAIGAAQHGHRGSLLTRAAISRRRTVAIEFGMCRSGRRGGAPGSVTVG